MNQAKLKSVASKAAKSTLILLGLYIIVVSLPWSCGLCAEDNIVESSSPDGNYLARAYVSDCGATTGFLTHFNLHSRLSWFNNEWVGTIKDGQVFANSCWSKVNFVWKDESNLEIQYEKCVPRQSERDPVWMKESSWKGINISYREMPRQVGNR